VKVVGQFVCRNRAAEAERALAKEGPDGIRWRLEEGGLIDDGVVGPVNCDEPGAGEDRDCGPPGRQPVRLLVEGANNEMADEIGAILARCGATRVQ
jgi:hypothetical protein